MVMKGISCVLVGTVLATLLGACQSNSVPEEALQLTHESMETRRLQTRRFETRDEEDLIITAAGLLQDLGYTLEESESELGILVASKDRDATEGGQVAGAIFVAALTGVMPAVDKVQKIRASIVTRPYGDSGRYTLLRVTFQRVVWNDHGQVSRRETIGDPEIYQEFFELLSKAAFLEAHNI